MNSLLAHGALGIFDEVIFLSISAVFVVMMFISWFRSRALEDEDTPEDSVLTPSSTPDSMPLE